MVAKGETLVAKSARVLALGTHLVGREARQVAMNHKRLQGAQKWFAMDLWWLLRIYEWLLRRVL